MGRIAIALVSLGLALGSAELGLRAVGYSRSLGTSGNVWGRWIVYDPILWRRNQPGFADDALGIRVNALGLRGPEIASPKPPGTVRVVCLGDSTTFGVFKKGPADFRASADYPGALASLLAGERRRVEVVNAGTLGATSSSGLALFATVLRRIEPDVLVVRLGNNDHSRIRFEAPPLATAGEYAVLRRLPAWALDAELVRLAFHAYRSWVTSQPWAREGRHVTLERYEQNLRTLVAEARAGGTRILFLDFPYRDLARGADLAGTFPNFFDDVQSVEELYAVHASYQQVTARVARETGCEYLRTEDALRAAQADVFTDYDLVHPNEDGARLIASLVRERLDVLGWLDVRPAD